MKHPARMTNVCTVEVIQFVNEYLKQTHLVLIIVLVKEIPGLLFLLDHLLAGRQRNLFPFRVKLLRG